MLIFETGINAIHDFTIGESVRINSGPLSGHEGILVKQNGKCRFGIQLKEINQFVTVNIHASMVERISFKAIFIDLFIIINCFEFSYRFRARSRCPL